MTIVAGYIPTPEGVAAVDHAIDLAVLSGAKLVVVNTGHYRDNANPSFATAEDLDALRDQLAQIKLEHEVRQVTQGRSAAEEVLDVASEVDATLIVIGIRRRTAVGKLITGSTAQQILLDADCPVLAVKARPAPTG